jgi:hypothetical protein
MKTNIKHGFTTEVITPMRGAASPAAGHHPPANLHISDTEGCSNVADLRSLDHAFLHCLDRDSALRNSYLRRRWQRSGRAAS